MTQREAKRYVWEGIISALRLGELFSLSNHLCAVQLTDEDHARVEAASLEAASQIERRIGKRVKKP